MSKYLSGRHSALTPYVPGEQPADMVYIKLNTNESPYPPPPSVISAVNAAEVSKLNLYPNPDGSGLINKLAEFYNVRPENVIIGNGSDELLAFAFLAFCDEKHGVAFPDITYGFYPVYAQLYGIKYEQIPLKDDLSIDPADYFNAGKNVVIANPNAPTGIALPLGGIEAIIKSNPGYMVLIDEAYVDFGAESALPLLSKYDNLLIVHTYSKSRSMAGARLSFALGAAPLIRDLNTMKYSFNPYNVNRLTQLMGEAALLDELDYADKRREIVESRAYATSSLKDLGFVTTDSKANFIFAKYPGADGFELYSALKEKGILVRHLDKQRISDYIRITIGTKKQMDALIDALADIIIDIPKGTNAFTRDREPPYP